MNARQLEEMINRLQAGDMLPSEFMSAVAVRLSDADDTQLDWDRARRCGFPEVVFAEGKPADSLVRILRSLHAGGVEGFATRVNVEQADAVRQEFPQAAYNALARTLRVPLTEVASERGTERVTEGRITIVTAGTSDRPVAEEARETALWMGVEVTMVQDVGVAGPHRLPARLAELETADAIVTQFTLPRS
jgi:NCAIR mutase (PurE)-related protein